MKVTIYSSIKIFNTVESQKVTNIRLDIWGWIVDFSKLGPGNWVLKCNCEEKHNGQIESR